MGEGPGNATISCVYAFIWDSLKLLTDVMRLVSESI